MKLAETYIMGLALAIPGLGPFLAFFLKTLGQPLLNWVLNKLSEWEVMQQFFLNTALRKASQAIDFVDAVNAYENLPKDASNEEVLAAEKSRMATFRSFVMVTN